MAHAIRERHSTGVYGNDTHGNDDHNHNVYRRVKSADYREIRNHRKQQRYARSVCSLAARRHYGGDCGYTRVWRDLRLFVNLSRWETLKELVLNRLYEPPNISLDTTFAQPNAQFEVESLQPGFDTRLFVS